MSNLRFSVVSGDQGTSITAFIDGQALSANDGHPNFEAILDACLGGRRDGLEDLFDTEAVLVERFNSISDRVQVRGGVVYFDGNPVHNTLTNHIVFALREGTKNFTPFVRFFERIEANPIQDSKEYLYQWLMAEKFSITDDGMIVGYKSVYAFEDGYRSVSSGTASVNGVEFQHTSIPQREGDVVTMPRSSVALDPSQACSVGLHVGTWNYASTFSGDVKIEVLVDPSDVVSVPHDCNGNKMRVCKYTVGRRISGKQSNVVVASYGDDDEYCVQCGGFTDDFCVYCEGCSVCDDDCSCD
jgi:hypothetical protein